jgi:hypothetical protein
MKRLETSLTVVIFGLLGALALPVRIMSQDASANMLRIPDGTPVQMALQEELNSATAHAGDSVHFEVTEDVRATNTVVIPSGSVGIGRIVDADHKKRMGRGGKLNFSVDYVKLLDGTNCKVRATAARQGKDKTGTVIAGTVLVSPLFLLMHGKDVDIPKGTAFTAYVDGEHNIPVLGIPPQIVGRAEGTTLAMPLRTTATSPRPSASSPSATASDPPAVSTGAPAAVALKSNPDGADISLDGDYVGSTPTSLHLKPGHHTITIEKLGFKIWQRSLNVQPDATITVQADLEKGI